MAAAARKGPAIPGFTTLSDQVLVRAPDASPPREGDPTTVIIYGWGDGLPKHVAKYADGYRELFPTARQVVVLSPIARAMFSDLRQRAEHMDPVVKAVFGEGGDPEERDVLIHTMSNTGAVNYAATLHTYREAHGSKTGEPPMPHRLLIMDSTPGSTDMSASNVSRWSRAMAIGTAPWFPWPAAVTQAIWATFLCLNAVYAFIIGRESAGAWSRRAVNDEAYEARGARKLYLYSKEDDLISWEDIEAHVAETRERGWEADTELFEGSGHVGHMRRHPQQYWATIRASWERARAAKVEA
ncbi:PaxU [Purpureocillium lavendulum]|uniref:PaxU n=1 Tax=Purpureocillium lavendulum TaxID=1247861 RepID=A0AB34FFM7_9HYPO|nr:PaxU [Purpureocillium lavendulum]